MSCRDALRADLDTSGRIQPAPSEGRHSWYYDTLSSPHLQPDPITISDDYGPAGAAGAWASPPHPSGPQDLSGTTGRTEQRTPPQNPLWPQYLSGTAGRPELHSDSRWTNNCYCATVPLGRQTYNAGYINMEIEAPHPWLAVRSNDPD